MRLTMLVIKDHDETPEVVEVYDEVAFEAHGGVPGWYRDKVSSYKRDGYEVREVQFVVHDVAIADLFRPREVGATAVYGGEPRTG